MKIKILSTAKGDIVAAALPPERGVRNFAEGGPAITGGRKFDELELPGKTRVADIPQLMRTSRVKRSKEGSFWTCPAPPPSAQPLPAKPEVKSGYLSCRRSVAMSGRETPPRWSGSNGARPSALYPFARTLVSLGVERRDLQTLDLFFEFVVWLGFQMDDEYGERKLLINQILDYLWALVSKR